MSRFLRTHRDDQGVVAIELVLVMPFIIALLACSITLAGLFQTKSRVVGAARDGARALALQPGVASPDADRYPADGITVTPDGDLCPTLTDPVYQSADPPKVTAKASTTYDLTIPFVGEWLDIDVSEKASMPCG